MSLKSVLIASALAAASTTAAMAQSEPGAGAPAAPNGAPYAPNASVAPSALPNGGAMGTQNSAAANTATTSADQMDGAQSAQPRAKMKRHSSTSVGGMSDRAPGSPPVNSTTTTTTTPPSTTPQ